MNRFAIWTISFCVILSAASSHAANKDSEFINAMRNGASMRLVLEISDDDRLPVAKAKVNVLMGMNYAENSYVIEGETDDRGVFVILGKTTGNEIDIKIEKDGFYPSRKKLCLIQMRKEHAVKDGKWQPWGQDVKLSLRRILNPAQLVCMKEGIAVPVTNEWVSFDMQCKDWVYPPSHKGKVGDFDVFVTWDGKVTAWSKMLKMAVRFPEADAGYYLADVTRESVFPGTYAAQTNRVLDKEFSCQVLNGSKRVYQGVVPHKQIVIRSRCVHDGQGNLIKANYSALNWFNIHGGFKGYVELAMSYMFNPIPNETNLEPR